MDQLEKAEIAANAIAAFNEMTRLDMESTMDAVEEVVATSKTYHTSNCEALLDELGMIDD